MIGRVIFLDIDGVCNTFDRYDRITTFPAPGMRSPLIVDQNIIAGLNYILDQLPRVKFVISSTWRYSEPDFDYYVRDVKDFCKVTGINPRYIHEDWRTELIGTGADRRIEVDEWLSRHPEVFKAVVVDDNYAALFRDKSKSLKYVRINPDMGLTFKDINKIFPFLGYKVRKDFSISTAGGPV